MTKMVYMYQFGADDDTMIIQGLRVVLVAQQYPDDMYPTVWMESTGDEQDEEFELVVFGTGHTIGDKHEHVGSAVCGGLVWHVYRMEKLNVWRS